MIQTVSGCNASCGFCPYPYLKNQSRQLKMPADIFKKIINECSGHKNIKVVMPYLMNEPLMDDRIAEKISYIKKSLPWVSSHILTNASLLDEKKSAEIIDSGLDWIGFSIHGIRPETIQKTMGISALEPVRKILEFIKKSENNNKDISKFIMVNFIKNQYISKEEELEIKKFWSDQGIKRISIYSHPISRAGNVPTLKAVHNYNIYGCNSIWANEMLHITSSGEIVLCCMDWKKEIVLGDVRKNTLKTIWGSDKYQDIRGQIKGLKSAQKSLICLRCECAQTEPVSSNRSVTLAIMPPWGVERPPVGLAVISQVLVSAGFTVKILDLNLSIYKNVEQDDKKYWDMDHTLYWRDPDFINSLIDRYPKIFAKIENDLKNDNSKIMAISVPTN
ncbi:MAG: radical SAM protein [Candidatus Omnitrophica bacterium]|nr:radical SAM protein [Candidatus Omnitrophota bacterium]